MQFHFVLSVTGITIFTSIHFFSIYGHTEGYTSSLSVTRHSHVTSVDQSDRSQCGTSHLSAEVFIAGAWFSIPCSPCHDDHKTRWCGNVTRWKPAGILNECEEVPWACSRLSWAGNKTVLFIPQHNLSYSEFYSRWCGHRTHSFCSHFIDENISAWVVLVQGLEGLCMLHRYGNNRSRCVCVGRGGQWVPLLCHTFQCRACLECPPPTSQSVHGPHILQSTAFCKLLNILLSLSSKFWLLNVYNLLLCESFI